MTVLVTGASGRVGSRFVPRLLADGETVRILVRDAGRAQDLRRLGAEVVGGDLTLGLDQARALEGVRTVVHLAAAFRTRDTDEVVSVTEDAAVTFGRAAADAGVERFVFVSTSLAYGPGLGRPAREDDEPRPDPTATYPVSKVNAERSLMRLYHDEGFPVVVLRLAFVYGEGDPHLAESMMWAHQWPAHKRLQMIHHRDVAQALYLALDPAMPAGRIFNVADDAPVTSWELHELNGEQMPAELASLQLNDPWEGIIDSARIRTELGFKPIYRTVYAARDENAL